MSDKPRVCTNCEALKEVQADIIRRFKELHAADRSQEIRDLEATIQGLTAIIDQTQWKAIERIQKLEAEIEQLKGKA